MPRVESGVEWFAMSISPSWLRPLTALFPKGVVAADTETLAAHSGDAWFASTLPQAVVFPRKAEEVAKVLRFANPRRIPVTATPWRMVPSTPARNAYLAWKSAVAWVARAANWAWQTSRGCTVSWRRPDADVVHWARTGQGPQVPSAKVITIVLVPRWVTGFQ